jgi:peptidoglycan/xylan/chitin deacetylase (PgdA/CDA1 family)
MALLKEDQARKEFRESRKTLASILGRKIDLFAFPHGEYTCELISWARQEGYTRLFSVVPSYPFSKSNEFLTGRILATPDDWPLEFRLKFFGAYCWLPLAFSLKKNVLSLLSR